METIRRSGAAQLDADQWRALRAGYERVLLDLGCGDGAWARRFAASEPSWLAVGVDSDRAALREAARRSERRPERGGAPNTLWVAAQVEHLPAELSGAADWLTVHFPWSALLWIILGEPAEFASIINRAAAPQSRLSLAINAEAPPPGQPPGQPPPDPGLVRGALEGALGAVGFGISECGWLSAAETPSTKWGGRLVKGSGRSVVGLEAVRS